MATPFTTNTILVIEDDEAIVRLLKVLFEREGYNVLISYNGKEGIETFQQAKQPIDLVIVDWIMPHIGGEETLAAIYRLDKEVKSIVLSGHVWGLECLQASAILAKPVSIDSLLYTVEHLLARDTVMPTPDYGVVPMALG